MTGTSINPAGEGEPLIASRKARDADAGRGALLTAVLIVSALNLVAIIVFGSLIVASLSQASNKFSSIADIVENPIKLIIPTEPLGLTVSRILATNFEPTLKAAVNSLNQFKQPAGSTTDVSPEVYNLANLVQSVLNVALTNMQFGTGDSIQPANGSGAPVSIPGGGSSSVSGILNEFVENTMSSASLQTLGEVCSTVNGNVQAVTWNGEYTRYDVDQNGEWIPTQTSWSATSGVNEVTQKVAAYCQSLKDI